MRPRQAGPAAFASLSRWVSSGSVVLGTLFSACSSPSTPSVLSPGCLGVPNQSCTSYPEGTQCPGSVCAACGANEFSFAQVTCTCQSGRWSCTTPQQAACASGGGPGIYSDPACTMPFQLDSGTDGPADAQGGGSTCGQLDDAGTEMFGSCTGGQTCCAGGAAGHYYCTFTDGGPCPAVP